MPYLDTLYVMMGDEKKRWDRWVSRVDGLFASWAATFNVLEFSSREFFYTGPEFLSLSPTYFNGLSRLFLCSGWARALALRLSALFFCLWAVVFFSFFLHLLFLFTL